jgi:hypothetical protein
MFFVVVMGKGKLVISNVIISNVTVFNVIGIVILSKVVISIVMSLSVGLGNFSHGEANNILSTNSEMSDSDRQTGRQTDK